MITEKDIERACNAVNARTEAAIGAGGGNLHASDKRSVLSGFDLSPDAHEALAVVSGNVAFEHLSDLVAHRSELVGVLAGTFSQGFLLGLVLAEQTREAAPR